MFEKCRSLPNFDETIIDETRANNTTSTGYFGIYDPWSEYDVYIKDNDAWVKAEVYI
jgi:hypothetical protein